MGKTYGAGISLAQTIGFKGNAPLVDDDSVETIDDLSSCRTYLGHRVYVASEDIDYEYTSQGWVKAGKGDGGLVKISNTDFQNLTTKDSSTMYAVYTGTQLTYVYIGETLIAQKGSNSTSFPYTFPITF